MGTIHKPPTVLISNGPSNKVRSVAYPQNTFERGSLRTWVGNHGQKYENFGALLAEYPSGLEEITDPVKDAVEFMEKYEFSSFRLFTEPHFGVVNKHLRALVEHAKKND